MASVTTGKKVPAFSLPATAGTFTSAAARGRTLVVYFYPRDNTPGCTREGEAFRDLHTKFRRAGATVIGISPDRLATHEKFKAKMRFPFELGADEDRKVAQLFGVWKEKTLYGRKAMGIERSTFLIDAEGVLRQAWRKVRVDGHAEAVLAAVKAL